MMVKCGLEFYILKFTETLQRYNMLKFIYSEKVTTFCEISTVTLKDNKCKRVYLKKKDLSYVVTVKSTVEISQNFVTFSEYMNFKIICLLSQRRRGEG